MTPRALVPMLLLLVLAGCPDRGKAPTATPPSPATEPAKATTKAPAPPPKPFDRATAKTPWKDAKVGDWAIFSMKMGKKPVTLKFEVTAVGPSTVTWVRKDPQTGEARGEDTVDLADEEARYKPWDKYDALDGAPAPAKHTIAGKEIDVLVVKRKQGENTTENWVAEQAVPPFNQSIVKSIRNGDLEFEMLDFGRGE